MAVKKIALLSAVTLMNPCFANLGQTWIHVCPVTDSLIESPQGDFSNCKVAVVDNGFDTTHPELAPALDEQGINGRDGGDNVDVSIVKDRDHLEFALPASHGSHVAGILRQMVPHIPIVPCKRGTSGKRDGRSDARCLEALLDRDDVKVVNLSFGINWFRLLRPICKLAKQGKMIVIAAGNEGRDIKDLNIMENRRLSDFFNLPYVQKRVVFVGATKKRWGIESLADFSNMPSPSLAPHFIAAPGSDIESFVPREISLTGRKKYSGTSMAAPVFAASLLRLVSEFNISVDEAREVLFDTSVKKRTPHHRVKNTGSGIMDFEKARNFLKQQRMKRGIVLYPSKTDEHLTELLEGVPTTAEEGRNIAGTEDTLTELNRGLPIEELPHFGFELLTMNTTTPVDDVPQESGFVKAVLVDAPIAAAQGVYNYMKSFLPS